MAENYQISQNLVVNSNEAHLRNCIRGELENISIELIPQQNLNKYAYAWSGAGELNLVPELASGQWLEGFRTHDAMIAQRCIYTQESATFPIIINAYQFIYVDVPIQQGKNYFITTNISNCYIAECNELGQILHDNTGTQDYKWITIFPNGITQNISYNTSTAYLRVVIECTEEIPVDGIITLTCDNICPIIPYESEFTITVSPNDKITSGTNYSFEFFNLVQPIYGGIITIDQQHQIELAITREMMIPANNITAETGYYIITGEHIKSAPNATIRSLTLRCNQYEIVAEQDILNLTKDKCIALTTDGKILLRDTRISSIEQIVQKQINILYERDTAIIYNFTGRKISLSEGDNYIFSTPGTILSLTYPSIDIEERDAANTFTYEVTLWTLQDEFITTLKWAHITVRGQIESPSIKLSDDGTRTFNFSIPKFYYQDDYKMLNPLWHQLQELPIEANMHKLKVVFNKNTKDQAVEEFLVTAVTESHENDAIMIDVSAEGLAFHELGKIGYKISLSKEGFYNATEDWFLNHIEDPAPKNNIQYWNDLVFKNSAKEWKYNWTYEIQMDWSSYSCNYLRDSSIVYEDEYVESWNTDENFLFWPTSIEKFKEKLRLVETSESNIYNITQEIAKTFGVYCKYEYEYDDSFHIIGRKVIYYNNYLQESSSIDGVTSTHLDLTYPYSSSSVKRIIDNTNVVTKMFVRTVDSNSQDSNIISIMNVDANRSREDYLLNFDYLYKIGTITEEQYNEIHIYEAKLHDINLQLYSIESKLEVLQNELVEVKAKETFYTNAIQLDQERYDNAIGLRNALTGGSNYIPIDEAKPGTLILHQDTTGERGYYVTLKYEGLDPRSVLLYTDIDYTKKIGEGRLTGLNTSGTFIYDEFNNLVAIDKLMFNGTAIPTMLYLVGLYSPWLYYDRVAKVWIARKAKDTEALAAAKETRAKLELEIYGQDSDYILDGNVELDALNIRTVAITDLEASIIGGSRTVDENNQSTTFDEYGVVLGLVQQQSVLLQKKEILINKFEKMMGPALREGYWSPEKYTDYGDNYIDQFSIGNEDNNNPKIMSQSKYLSFSWDRTKLFDNEESILFQSSVDGTMRQYLTIIIPPSIIPSILNNINNLSFIYYDTVAVNTLSEMIIREKNLPENIQEWNEAQTTIFNEAMDRLQNVNLIRSFTIGSQCEFGFIREKDSSDLMRYLPAIIVTGSKLLTDEQINFIENAPNEYKPFLGVYNARVENNTVNYDIINIATISSTEASNAPYFIGDAGTALTDTTRETYNLQRVFPRIFINSLKLKNSEDELLIKLNNKQLTAFEDYYTIIDTYNLNGEELSGYYITLKPEKIFQEGMERLVIDISYALSNADISIYLDALKIMKENAFPKVSYEIALCALDFNLMRTAYNKLNRVVHINDIDLQLQDVCGYISSITIDLDKPWETTAEIKNYETKFEDLFSTIVAQTEAMQKNEGAISQVLNAFSPTGEIVGNLLQNSIMKADLNYSFNQGKLTIDNENGIWGISDAGVVAFRGGGIFTATSKDESGNWKWNTGILPNGINANLITTGQLDTNKIRIFAGDQIQFQLNGDGLFAYKSFYNDKVEAKSAAEDKLNTQSETLDPCQYVVFNENGLFLTTKKGAWILNEEKNGYTQMGTDVNRVEISWDGLILRNMVGNPVFYADPDTGNLTLEGKIETSSGKIGGWTIGDGLLSSDYINLISKDTPGIFLTGSTATSLKTINYNGQTYYMYKNATDETDTTLYYLDTLQTDGRPVSSCYTYQSTHTNVQPLYTYIDEITTSETTTQSVSGEEAEEAGKAFDASNEELKKTTKIYIVAYEGSNEPIKYDGVNIEYDFNTSLNADWYTKMLSIYGVAITNYVKYTDTSSLLPYEFTTPQQLKLDTFLPNFSVEALTGNVFINKGTLGGFNLSASRLESNYNMTIANTNIAEDNYVGGNSNYALSRFKNCFCDFTTSADGSTFTLTNIAGVKTTFNIASTKFFQDSMWRAGQLVNPGSSISGNNVIFTIESGYGSRHTRTHNATSIYRKGQKNAYDNIHVTNPVYKFHLYPTAIAVNFDLSISGTSYGRTMAIIFDGTNLVKTELGKIKIDSAGPPSGSWSSEMGRETSKSVALRVHLNARSGFYTGYADTTINAERIWLSGYQAAGKKATCTSKNLEPGDVYKFEVPSGYTTRPVTIRANCLAAGTLVKLFDNTEIPIEDLKLNMQLLGYNEETKRFMPVNVKMTQVLKNRNAQVADIYLSNNRIVTITLSHPFLTDHGWAALDVDNALKEYRQYNIDITLLQVGDILISPAVEKVVIQKIVNRPDLANIDLYNIDVEPYNTYLAENVIVHNKAAKL